ncbi:hypothetical protein [Halosimplex sp. J119]
MSDGEDGSLWRAGLGIVLLLTNLVVAVAAGVAIALRGIVWLPDALVGAGLVAEITTPVVVASMLVVFLVAGLVMYTVLMLGLAASNALAELLGFELRE